MGRKLLLRQVQPDKSQLKNRLEKLLGYQFEKEPFNQTLKKRNLKVMLSQNQSSEENEQNKIQMTRRTNDF